MVHQKASAPSRVYRPELKQLLDGDGIKINPKESKTMHKNGRVEKNYLIFEIILEIGNDYSRENKCISQNVGCAILNLTLANIIYWIFIFSSFQLARRYTPSVTRVIYSIVPPKFSKNTFSLELEEHTKKRYKLASHSYPQQNFFL